MEMVRCLARSDQRQKLRTEVQRLEETAGKQQAILFLMLALTSKSVVSTLVDDEMLLHLLLEEAAIRSPVGRGEW